MRPNEDRSGESTEDVLKRFLRDYQKPGSMLMEPVQGSIDARIEDTRMETPTFACVDTASVVTLGEFDGDLLRRDASTGGNK